MGWIIKKINKIVNDCISQRVRDDYNRLAERLHSDIREKLDMVEGDIRRARAFDTSKLIDHVIDIDAKVNTHDNLIKPVADMFPKMQQDIMINTLYIKGKISKEEAKRIYELYESSDEENHIVADTLIVAFNKKI